MPPALPDNDPLREEKMEYELMESFEVDAHELDGLTRRQCFTLGVEWKIVADLLDAGRAISRPLNIDNGNRVERMCQRRGRQYAITLTADSRWLQLDVEAM